MRGPLDIITPEQAERLWAIGYTLAQRPRDPFHVDPAIVPKGRFYQWNDKLSLTQWRQNNWIPVLHERHPGMFGPLCLTGPVEIGGLALMEKNLQEVEQDQAKNVAAAYRLEDEWMQRAKADGLIGGARMTHPSGEHKVGEPDAVKGAVKIPASLWGHTSEVFAERDRLLAERMKQGLPSATLADKEAATLAAIAVIETRLKEQSDNGKAPHRVA